MSINPINYTDPMGLEGWNINAGTSTEWMVFNIGAAINISGSFGYYYDAKQGVSSGKFGATFSFGGYAGGQGWGWHYPQTQKQHYYDRDTSHVGYGAEAGCSVGISKTNANSVNDLAGYSDNYNINPQIRRLPISFQHSVSNNITVNTVSFGKSFGYSASQYPTNTWTREFK